MAKKKLTFGAMKMLLAREAGTFAAAVLFFLVFSCPCFPQFYVGDGTEVFVGKENCFKPLNLKDLKKPKSRTITIKDHTGQATYKSAISLKPAGKTETGSLAEGNSASCTASPPTEKKVFATAVRQQSTVTSVRLMNNRMGITALYIVSYCCRGLLFWRPPPLGRENFKP
ncbi:MAG: hypothetical protein LBR64_03930 [Dysgonamonadaceae bacterium]|jgi:hypothetical protein|nr:hypothetical protein [Dysgonamonadaceae bacterium]